MKKRFTLAEDNPLLFRQTVVGAKPLLQDRVRPPLLPRTKPPCHATIDSGAEVDASFYFSDEF